MKHPGNTAVTPQDVLDFWFAPEHQKYWFKSTPEFDAEIQKRFERTCLILADAMAVTGLDWYADPQSHLAEIIALDQFPRNMYRGSPKAFAWDELALSSAKQLIESGGDMDLSDGRRSFVYMPFMHAENLAAQNRCVELSGSRLDGQGTLRSAISHRDVIEEFGRFQHRNETLGRISTDAEQAFLSGGGYDPS
jgi:uncharacterized protein (DUF924 family)